MTTGSRTRVDPTPPGETAPAEEGFVTRWSRRKQAARSDEKILQEPSPNVAGVVAPAPAPVLTDKDMPLIEGLTEESDFRGFLSPGVSETLRRQALRKLFHLPVFNTRCPLDSEYYDCHGYEPLGNIITHEMREALEREAEELKLAARAARPPWMAEVRSAKPSLRGQTQEQSFRLLDTDKTARASLSPNAQEAPPTAMDGGSAGNAGAVFPPVVGAEQAANPDSPTTEE